MSPDRWEEERRNRRALEAYALSLEGCCVHYALYRKYPPDFFQFTTSDRERAIYRAFASGDGWAARLLMSCPNITHYTLSARALGIAEEDADPSKLYDPETLRRCKKALRRLFGGTPHRWKIEAVKKIHAHVLADASVCPPTLRLGSACARPCENYYETVVGYLSKPALSYTAEALHLWLEARRRLGRLPRLSGVSNIPRNPAKPELNDLREYIDFQPSNPPLEMSSEEPAELCPANPLKSSPKLLRSPENLAHNPSHLTPHWNRKRAVESASVLPATFERVYLLECYPVRLPLSLRARPPPSSVGICSHWKPSRP